MQNARERLCAEALATFCLVFAGTGAVVVDQLTGGRVTGLGISLVFGLIVLAMIYTVGHVSGAHMNPAVTAAFCAAGRHKLSEFLPYALAQLAGALAASAALRALFGNGTTLGVTLPAGSEAQSFVLEFILTFMLMFTVMGVATDDRAEGAMAGIAIGGLIAVEAIFGGPICGASMNPARSLAPALVSGNLSHIWLYLVAPTLGAIAGALAYRLIKEPAAA
jgi:aquaporin Z